jgi:hypothetical protein
VGGKERGWGQGGEMNQALYAHMNNKREKNVMLGTGDMTQAVRDLPNKCEALSSTPPPKKKMMLELTSIRN